MMPALLPDGNVNRCSNTRADLYSTGIGHEFGGEYIAEGCRVGEPSRTCREVSTQEAHTVGEGVDWRGFLGTATDQASQVQGSD